MKEVAKMAEQENDMIMLLDEEGEEHRFTVEDMVVVGDQSYFILLPEEGFVNDEDEDDDEDDDDLDEDMEDEDEDEDEVEYLVFRIETIDGEDQLVLVDDDEELERVAAAWAEMDEDPDDTEN